jgi:hypothetical protein
VPSAKCVLIWKESSGVTQLCKCLIVIVIVGVGVGVGGSVWSVCLCWLLHGSLKARTCGKESVGHACYYSCPRRTDICFDGNTNY